MSIFHITWTSTYSEAGGYQRDAYVLWDDGSFDPTTGILKTANSDGEFSNKASREGGPYHNMKEACEGAGGNPKIWSAIGCPGSPPANAPSAASPSGSSPGIVSRIAGWLFPSRQRFKDGWEGMTGRESGGLERVAGGLSLLGAGCEVALTFMGIMSLWKWGLRSLGKKAVEEVATTTLTPAVEAAMARAENVAVRTFSAVEKAPLGQIDLFAGERIEALLKAMGNVRKAGWPGSLKDPELVRKLIDPSGLLSAAQRNELIQVIGQRMQKMYITAGY